jgi:catechol 2,3-dioxygenase-like lactoylglutathione lyase family enzyme
MDATSDYWRPDARGTRTGQLAMITITRLNHTAINTPGEVGELKTFYQEHFGVQTVPRDIPPEYEALVPGFWMQFDNGQVHVIKNDVVGKLRNPMGPHIAYYVTSLDDAQRYLDEQGIPYDMTNRIIILSDPAGNTIELQQDPDIC